MSYKNTHFQFTWWLLPYDVNSNNVVTTFGKSTQRTKIGNHMNRNLLVSALCMINKSLLICRHNYVFMSMRYAISSFHNQMTTTAVRYLLYQNLLMENNPFKKKVFYTFVNISKHLFQRCISIYWQDFLCLVANRSATKGVRFCSCCRQNNYSHINVLGFIFDIL